MKEATLDRTKNEIAHNAVVSDGFPTIYLFTAADPMYPKEFLGERNTQAIMSFLSEHLTYSPNSLVEETDTYDIDSTSDSFVDTN